MGSQESLMSLRNWRQHFLNVGLRNYCTLYRHLALPQSFHWLTSQWLHVGGCLFLRHKPEELLACFQPFHIAQNRQGDGFVEIQLVLLHVLDAREDLQFKGMAFSFVEWLLTTLGGISYLAGIVPSLGWYLHIINRNKQRQPPNLIARS